MYPFVIKYLAQRFIAPAYNTIAEYVTKHRQASRTNQGCCCKADSRNQDGRHKDSSVGCCEKSEGIRRRPLYSCKEFLQSRRKETKSRQKLEVSRFELVLLFFLGYLISYTYFYYYDGGLLASLYCAENGETEECYRLMELAK